MKGIWVLEQDPSEGVFPEGISHGDCSESGNGNSTMIRCLPYSRGLPYRDLTECICDSQSGSWKGIPVAMPSMREACKETVLSPGTGPQGGSGGCTAAPVWTSVVIFLRVSRIGNFFTTVRLSLVMESQE